MGPGDSVNIIEDKYWIASGRKVVLQSNSSIFKVGELIGQNHDWDLEKVRVNPSP